MKKIYIVLFYASFFLMNTFYSVDLYCQERHRLGNNFSKEKIKSYYEIPFTYVNNLIIINVKIGPYYSGNYIFDTGAQFSLITEPLLIPLLNIELEKEHNVMGADGLVILTAYRTNTLKFKMGNLTPRYKKTLVFKYNYINLDKITGMEIHGIIGVDFLLNKIFSIDYKRHKIRFYKINDKPKLNSYNVIDLYSNYGRPLLKGQIIQSDNKTKDVNLLVDTGASLSLLLNQGNNEMINNDYVPMYLGDGIGGNLIGSLGRLKSFKFGDISFENMVVNYQKETFNLDSLKLLSTENEIVRDGLIGNRVLDNFKNLFDLSNNKLYLKRKKKNFKNRVNTTGIFTVIGKKNSPYIIFVSKNSPAALAGIEKGWFVKSINRIPVQMIAPSNVFKFFESKPGKKIRLKLYKNGAQKIVVFRCKNLI